jgi:hypothetical protein
VNVVDDLIFDGVFFILLMSLSIKDLFELNLNYLLTIKLSNSIIINAPQTLKSDIRYKRFIGAKQT